MSVGGAGPIMLANTELRPEKTDKRVSSDEQGSASDQYLHRVLSLVNKLVTIVYLLI